MKIKTIVDALDAKVISGRAGLDADLSSIEFDSRMVAPSGNSGPLFIAVPGEHVDGQKYVKKAVERGAACVLARKATDGIDVTQIIVDDVRRAMSRASDVFYGEPTKKLITVGVTGTNGKTTTTYLIESIFKAAGFTPGVLGTINYRWGGVSKDASHTTPEAPVLQSILRQMLDAGVTHAIMEVSSHSLEQKRVNDCRFNAAVFTNLTHDHLDYHKTMEKYFESKAILFRTLLKETHGFSILNIDDQWGRVLKKELTGAITYSLGKGAAVHPKYYELKGNIRAAVATPAGQLNVDSPLVGEYNLQNILAAVATAYSLGIENEAITAGINGLKAVPGRLQKISVSGKVRFAAFVDYAHTDDALMRAIGAVKEATRGRVITVFGCGGNRDKTKRPKMGSVSARLSNISIITSDNPRDEDPVQILREVEAGMNDVKKLAQAGRADDDGYLVIEDRGEAIKKAIELARTDDAVLVAGKGHENYQIIKGHKSHFDDIEALRSAIADRYGAAAIVESRNFTEARNN